MSFLSKLFGSEKKDTTYNGPKPITTLNQVQGGPEYYQTILDRMYGRNVGFGDDYASKYSNPIIQNMRSQFTDYQLPELKSELSATGRRRGSGGFDQIRRAYNEQGLQEGDVYSRLQQRNEDQMRNEINDAMGRVGDFAKNEAGLFNNYVNFENANNNRQVAEATARRQAEAAGYQNLLFAGSDLMGSLYGGQGAFKRQPVQSAGMNFQQYGASAPPAGYDLSGIASRNSSRNAQVGRIR